MTQLEETSSALARVASALVRASYVELAEELGDASVDYLREKLKELARTWLTEGLNFSTSTDTEDACADQLLAALGLTRKDVGAS